MQTSSHGRGTGAGAARQRGAGAPFPHPHLDPVAPDYPGNFKIRTLRKRRMVLYFRANGRKWKRLDIIEKGNGVRDSPSRRLL